MKSDKLLDKILLILYTVKENSTELQKILDFLHDNIAEEEEEEVEEITLPSKYDKAVKEIAGSIDAGLVCYLNPDTLETDDVPKGLIDDPYEMEVSTGISLEEWNFKNTQWEKCITIEPLSSNESFHIMEQFTNRLTDIKYKERLCEVLHERKPFANFKRVVDNSPFRQDWFDFNNKCLQQHVRAIITQQL